MASKATKNGLEGKWAAGFTDAQAKGVTKSPEAPVANFPLHFIWHTGPWFDVFELQIQKIKRDIARAKAEDRVTVYLSCPISSRGGGYSATNVDVAKHVERDLLGRWGESFWILNPAQYQLESKAGTGLMNEHAEYLKLDLDRLIAIGGRPLGGDYMRMWTRVLVENELIVGGRELDPKFKNTGQFFDAFYFIGPRDVQSFFLSQGQTVTAGIQTYFARKFATEPDFREEYTDPNPDWRRLGPRTAANQSEYALRDRWNQKRLDFLRYYGVRASANYSLGCHDEWLIFCGLNKLRRDKTRNPDRYMIDGDVGEQIAGFFDGGQIDPASSETVISRGYAR